MVGQSQSAAGVLASMPTAAPSPFTLRVNRIREDLRAAALDAFVVTHLPNLRYLTGFTGTAGAAIVTPERCLLIADFRHATAARELIAARPDGSIELEIPDRGYDEAIVAILGRIDGRRIGIEATSMSVSRFNSLSASLAARVPAADDSRPPSPALVPMERRVEARRVVKDAAEVATLREAARRLSAVARHVLPLVREAGRNGRLRPRSMPLSGPAGSSGPLSARSSPPARTARVRTPGRAIGPSRWGMGWCWTSGGSTTDTAWI